LDAPDVVVGSRLGPSRPPHPDIDHGHFEACRELGVSPVHPVCDDVAFGRLARRHAQVGELRPLGRVVSVRAVPSRLSLIESSASL